MRAISLYCDLVAASVLKGLESNLEQNGVDIGESKDLTENIINEEISDVNISNEVKENDAQIQLETLNEDDLIKEK